MLKPLKSANSHELEKDPALLVRHVSYRLSILPICVNSDGGVRASVTCRSPLICQLGRYFDFVACTLRLVGSPVARYPMRRQCTDEQTIERGDVRSNLINQI
ncbi:hypothetical protein FVEG_17002 [Fusarium verticillioides 7600]|uniref:Uncharacterized protein n=1 Tax=Gibberella moniliformis (strain M3125 / FGSC 7600) TaxID=334819 RepID=W7MXS5_GIBM7|nr:hypothetical protein FVEG_17002 [Fusarium verticillioides 7600]EWG52644.1 hypothetical protein FVEG_17002 [Fusarium verticillioides 7600]